MRILFTSFPGEGHLQPMLPLARAAVVAGHDVVVATGPDMAPHVERRGFTAWPAGRTMAEAFGARFPPMPDGASRFFAGGTAVFVPAAERFADELLPRAVAWGPHLVVSEILELAGLVVAARTGARHVLHGLGPLPVPAHWTDLPAFAELCHRWGLDGPDGGLTGTPFLDVCPPSLHLRPHAAGQPVRPLRPAAGDAPVRPDGRILAAVDALPHPRTVHLTLGTIVNRVPGAFADALAGLRRLEANVVVTVGADVDPAALGPQPPHVLVERYLPHAALLPRCSALVAHAGAATLLAGFRHGLPQLLLPRAGDQFDNAGAAVRSGAALRLDPGEAWPDAIAETTARLLDEPSYGCAARRLRDTIAAMPGPDRVLAGLLSDEPRPVEGRAG